MRDLFAFMADQIRWHADHELEHGRVKTWPVTGNNWVSGFLINGLPCYVIGGPEFVDGRVFATLRGALAAIAQNFQFARAEELSLEVLRSLNVVRPEQRDVGGGCYFLELIGVKQLTLLIVGPGGPHGRICNDEIAADSAAYELTKRRDYN